MSEKDFSKRERKIGKSSQEIRENINRASKKGQNAASVKENGEISDTHLGECSHKTTNAELLEQSPTRKQNTTNKERELKNSYLLRSRQPKDDSRKTVQGTRYLEGVSNNSQPDKEKKLKLFSFKKCRDRQGSKIRFMNTAESIPRAFEYASADKDFSFTKNVPKQPKEANEHTHVSEEEVDADDDNESEGDGSINRVKRVMQWYEKRKAEKEALEQQTSLTWKIAEPNSTPWEGSVDDPVAMRPTMVDEADFEEAELSGSSSQYSPPRNRHERPFGDAGEAPGEQRRRRRHRHRKSRDPALT